VCNEPGSLARSSKARNRRKELQHRIARLERLYESVLKDGGKRARSGSPARFELVRQWKHLQRGVGRTRSPEDGEEEEFVLRDDVFPRDIDELHPLPRSPSQFPPDGPQFTFPSLKDQHTRRLLLAAIPSPQFLRAGLLNNRYWWSDVPSLGFDAAAMDPRTKADLYASWILSSAPPAEVAKSLHMIVSLLPEHTASHVLALIDDAVVADAEHAASLTGLEVALMQCRWYLDFGDFARSWSTVQRAIALARRLGLHAARSTARHDVIWTGLFQADRLQGLMLATPCGIGAGLGADEFGYDPEREVPPQHFLTSLGVVTGKMLFGGIGGDDAAEDAAAALRRLDDELLALRRRFPAFYWHVDAAAPRDQNEAFFWMTKVINRLHYHLVRIALHAPGMVRALRRSPGGGPLDESGRAACLDSARELLDLFCVARGAGNEEAYANKVLDLYAFVAAAVLAVGAVCSSSCGPGSGAGEEAEEEEEREEDWATVLRITEILEDASSRPFGKLAAQSRRALRRIIDFRRVAGGLGGGVRIMVPFVGVVTLTRTYANHAEPSFEPWRVSSSGDVFDRHRPAVQEVEAPTCEGGAFLDLAAGEPFSYHDLTNKFFDPLFTAYVPTANMLYSNDLHDINSGLAWVHDGDSVHF
jgi:hypothetical protein